MINIKEIYYNLIYGIQNLFLYFSVIWKDRNWDSYWIYTLLRKKLQLMAKNFEKHNRYVGVEKDIKKMRFCIKVLDRLIKDDYFDPKNELKEKWGEYIYKDSFNNLNDLLRREKVKTEEDEEEYDKDLSRMLNISEINKERDLRLLFRVLELNIENWWD